MADMLSAANLEKSMSLDQIESAIKKYIHAATYGVKDDIIDLFHPNFKTAGKLGDQLAWFDRDTIIGICEENAISMDEPLPVWKILDSNVLATSAFAVVESKSASSTFIEILRFLYADGRWQLAFKSFETRG